MTFNQVVRGSSPRRLTKGTMMIYLPLIIIVVIIVMILYMTLETFLLQVNKVSFSANENDLKILHMSDIHIKFMNVSAKKICRVIKRETPDIIMLSGDFIASANDTGLFLSFWDKIATGIPLSCKIFACLGNHEYEAFVDNEEGLDDFVKSIESKGIKVLRNETVSYEKNSKTYKIIGLNDKRYSNIDTEVINKNADVRSTNIVLAHNPDTILQIPENTVDYMFCGHFHGGQIWLPFNLEFTLLRREKLCRMGMKRGLHEYSGIKLYINRGLGCVVIPFRFLSVPEISIYIV